MVPVSKRRLGNTGLAISEIGLGAGPMGNLYEPMSEEAAQQVVHNALDAGINYIDTAPFYGFGLSERRVGNGLRGHTDIVLSSKVGRLLVPDANITSDAIRYGFRSAMPFNPVFDYSHDGILRSHEASLHRLGLACIDILYIHDIGIDTHGPSNSAMWDQLTQGGGLRALDKLRSEKSITAFGLGVNEIAACMQLMKHIQVDVMLLAGRYTLLEQGAMDALLPACTAANTAVVIGAPYNSGILAIGTRTGRIPNYNYAPAAPEILARVAQIEVVCDRHSISLSAAALQFPLAHPQVSSVVAGIANLTQLDTTLRNYGTTIPSHFWAELKAEGLMRADAVVPRH